MSMSKKVLWTLVGITAVLLVVHLGMQYLNLSLDEKHGQVFELSNRVDMDDEVSLPTWFSQFLLLAVGVTALVASKFETSPGRRKVWKLVGVVGVLFAIDEAAAIHEFVLQSLHLLRFGEDAPTAALNAWWIVLPLIGAVGGWFLWWIVRTLPARTVKLLLLAGVVYLAGAVGIELTSNDFVASPFLYQGVLTGVEEVLEMLGSILALYTVLDYLERHQPAKLAKLLNALSGRS